MKALNHSESAIAGPHSRTTGYFRMNAAGDLTAANLPVSVLPASQNPHPRCWMHDTDIANFEKHFKELRSGKIDEITMICRPNFLGSEMLRMTIIPDSAFDNGGFLCILQNEKSFCEDTEILKQSKRDDIFSDCLRALVSEDDVSKTLQTFAEKFSEKFGTDSCATLLYNDDNSIDYLHVWANSQIYLEHFDASSFRLDRNENWVKILESNETILIADINEFPTEDEVNKRLKKANIMAFVSHGIFRGGKLVGSVYAAFSTPQKNIDEAAINAIRVIANSISLILGREEMLRKLRQNLSEKAQIIDHINLPIILLDTDNNVLLANKAAHMVEGVSLEELAGVHLHDPKAAVPNCPLCKAKAQKSPYSFEIEKNGRHIFTNIVPVLDGDNMTGFLAFAVDTTSDHEKIKNLESAKNEAEKAMAQKSSFIAHVSHEIRTPLNAILGLSELLSQDKTLPPDAAESVESIHIAGKALLPIINNVLELSKIEAEAEAPIFGWTNIDEILRETRSIFHRNASIAGIWLEVKTPPDMPLILSDEARIRQALINLVGNSMKFTEKGGITISCEISNESADRADLKLVVTDTGSGIPEFARKYLFSPYFQTGKDMRKRALGTGLGLSIVKKLTNMLGGEIRLESEIGKGSSFIMEFKNIATKPKVAENTKPAQNILGKRSFDSLNIWVIDDVELNCKVLKRMLEKLGTKCEATTSPAEYLRRAKSGELPDLVIIDMWMEEMSGLEFSEAFHTIAAAKNIPIILASADSYNQEAQISHEFCDILLKPVTLDSLETALAKIVEPKKNK